MIRLGEGYDLPFPRDRLGELDGRFVGFSAGRQQHDLGQVRRLLGQLLRKTDDRLGDHGRVEMVERAGCLPDRGDDFRVAMAENRAHLSRREVEHPRAVLIVQIAAAGTDRHEAREVAAEAKKMPVGTNPDAAAHTVDIGHGYTSVELTSPTELLSGKRRGRLQRIVSQVKYLHLTGDAVS